MVNFNPIAIDEGEKDGLRQELITPALMSTQQAQQRLRSGTPANKAS